MSNAANTCTEIVPTLRGLGFDSAEIVTPGMIAIFDENTGSWWTTSIADASDLAARVIAGEPDAYSDWCSGAPGVEIGPSLRC